jgi:hypothetical protein
VLVPGPESEIAVVREIYERFVNLGETEATIAAALNARGILTDLDKDWTRGTVHEVLINEKYIGNNVWGRTSFKLKHRHVTNEPENWIRANNVFKAIIGQSLYDKAQAIIVARSERLTDDELLEKLKLILQSAGTLSGLIIDEFDHAPSSSVYRHRFGSLLRAYALVGFATGRDYRYLDINRHLRLVHPPIVTEVIDGLRACGAIVTQNPKNDILTVNSEFTVSVVIVRCLSTSAGALRWKLRLDSELRPDFTVAVRMNSDNSHARDYYILPRLSMYEASLRLCEYNGLSLDAYRFDDLTSFFEFGRRREMRSVA